MSNTTKPVKVSDLSGPALDWAVAKCEKTDSDYMAIRNLPPVSKSLFNSWLEYSSDWSLAGPIIEREGITVGANGYKAWVAQITNTTFNGFREGPTPLIAAMRVYVASKLGDTIEIPEELV